MLIISRSNPQKFYLEQKKVSQLSFSQSIFCAVKTEKL